MDFFVESLVPFEFTLKAAAFFISTLLLALMLLDRRNRFHLRHRFSNKPRPVLFGFVASYIAWLMLSLWWLRFPLLETMLNAPRELNNLVAALLTVMVGFGLALFLGQLILVRFVALFALFSAVLIAVNGFFPYKTDFFESIAIELFIGGIATFCVFLLFDSFYEHEEKERFDALGNKIEQLETQLDQVHKELVRQRSYPTQRDESQPASRVRIRPKPRPTRYYN